MKFQFSGNLLRYVDFCREVGVDGDTVEEGAKKVVEKFPNLENVIHDSDGRIRLLHRFFLNGELLGRADFDRRVGPNDVVLVLTPIAGG